MDVSKVKRMIGHCNSMDELREVKKAVGARQNILIKRARQKKRDEKVEWARTLKVDEFIYCCAEGTFLGGPLQRGDALVVEHWQPRAKRLWVRTINEDRQLWFEAKGMVRYDLRSEKPDNPVSDSERRLANRVSEVAEECFIRTAAANADKYK